MGIENFTPVAGHKYNELCSVLHPVAKGATCCQVVNNTFLSQSNAVMEKVVAMLRGDTQEVRVAEAFVDDTPAVKSTEVDVLSLKTQQVKRVLIGTMTKEELGFVSHVA